MASFTAFKPLFESAIGDPEGRVRGSAHTAVSSAESVRDAAERLNLFDDLTEDQASETRAVFDALPPEVDRQILEALSGALERGAAITVGWQEDPVISAEVSETTPGGGVHILLHCPDGREFL
jgi:hypothetical protein